MAHGLTLLNQKGGVGKSTLSCQIAGALNQFGKDVLVVDIDPQGNLTKDLGLRDYWTDFSRELIINDVLKYKEDNDRLSELVNAAEEEAYRQARKAAEAAGDSEDAVSEYLPAWVGEFDFVPSHKLMNNLSDDHLEDPDQGDRQSEDLADELLGTTQSDERLYSALQAVDDDYDYIIVDSPPSNDKPSDNAIIATKNVLVPLEASESGGRGIDLLTDQVNKLTGGFGTEERNITYRGILINKIGNDKESKEETEQIEASLPNIPKWRIRNRTGLSLQESHQGSVFTSSSRVDMEIVLLDIAATQIAYFEGAGPEQTLSELVDPSWAKFELGVNGSRRVTGQVAIETLNHYKQQALELVDGRLEEDLAQQLAESPSTTQEA